MTATENAARAQRGFQLSLPEGFVELPLDHLDLAPSRFEQLKEVVANEFGLPATSDSAQESANAFAQLGSIIGDGGVDYSAIAYYKSPDDPLRPIMVALTGIAVPSDHRNAGEGVNGLLEVHRASEAEAVEEIQLPVGHAVTTVTEEQNALIVEGEPTRIVTRQLSAWIPDRDGTTIGVVSVITNSFQDWEHVCVLALDIFDTFGWEPLSG